MPFNCSSATSHTATKPSPTTATQQEQNTSSSQKQQQQQQQHLPLGASIPSATESHEQLLSNAQPPATSLTRPNRPRSITSSIYSDASTLAVPYSTAPYRGFPSREAYMSALEDFIESKMYMSSHARTLTGFYGPETMEEVIATRPDVEFGWQKRRRARKAEKARRMTVAPGMEVLPEQDEQSEVRRVETGEEQAAVAAVQGSSSSLGQGIGGIGRLSRVFSRGRRATVA